jgi:hypothetical protein
MFEVDATWELVYSIRDSAAEESMLMASRMAMVGELLSRRIAEVEAEDPDPGYMMTTGFSRTTSEVAAALSLSPKAAGEVVSQADALTNRLPKVAAVLAAGKVAWHVVQLIVARTELVADFSVCARLDADLAARIGKWQSWSRKRVINAVDAAVRDADPDAIREREKAEDQRHVWVRPRADGTTSIECILTARAATAFDGRLTLITGGVCTQDPRTMDQRRADAVEALSEGRELACQCGLPDCPAADPGAPTATRVVINVIAAQSTIAGGGNAPGYLTGYGVIDAKQVEQLAAHATLRPLAEPNVSAAEALRYQPGAALARWIRCRDLTCRFPGCDRPAERCDIDHTVPFDHNHPDNGGMTVPWNLKCLCRQHHRLKTFVEGWRDEQLADGTVIWTSPTGEVYRTTSGVRELLPSGTACRAPTPTRINPAHFRSARITRRRAKNHRLRPINAEARRCQQARTKEIRRRVEHNRMRRTLRMFKGDNPSTSPFCAWINDPIEPEELPPDWKPPPPPPPLPDDPPF